MSVIKSICTAVAVTSILRFVQRFKSKLAPHRAFPKLLAFKGVIFVNVFQTVRRSPEASVVAPS